MSSIHLVMPMGGAGSRFYKDGYMQPKPLIEIKGKPFFYWAAMSIVKFVETVDITFIVLRQHVDEFEIDMAIKKYFPRAEIKILPEMLPGPVFTALKGVESINDDIPVLFNDCDHLFRCNEIYQIVNSGNFDMDGALLTFKSEGSQFSYVKYNEYGSVVGTVEKKVVSDCAICGAYVFRSVQLFKDVAEIYVGNCPYRECFMSGLYNIMCDQGMVVKDYLLDFHIEFGTPEEYEIAKESEYFDEFI